jgi:predicted PolB exonuclease-like 3'-5' exonuclease
MGWRSIYRVGRTSRKIGVKTPRSVTRFHDSPDGRRLCDVAPLVGTAGAMGARRLQSRPMAGSGALVLDIETVPDRELWTPPPEGAPGERDRSFPPLYACRPVVIGVIWLDDDLSCRRIGILGEGKSEAEMMADFGDFVSRVKPLLVTWNGRSFDLPVLALRALRHGVDFGWYYRGLGYRYRFSEDGHLDLGDVIADFGAARMTSLDGAARLIGLPGKLGVDGSQVEGLFQAGQMDALRRYCLSDVAQTAFVLLRYRLVTRDITVETYRRAAEGLLAALEADGRFGPLLGGTDRARLLLPEARGSAPPRETPVDAGAESADEARDQAQPTSAVAIVVAEEVEIGVDLLPDLDAGVERVGDAGRDGDPGTDLDVGTEVAKE